MLILVICLSFPNAHVCNYQQRERSHITPRVIDSNNVNSERRILLCLIGHFLRYSTLYILMKIFTSNREDFSEVKLLVGIDVNEKRNCESTETEVRNVYKNLQSIFPKCDCCVKRALI